MDKLRTECDAFREEYVTHEARVASFKYWPYTAETRSPISEYADAGFFYTGSSDKVECMCCGEDFDHGDNVLKVLPWHAYYNAGRCQFLRILIKRLTNYSFP